MKPHVRFALLLAAGIAGFTAALGAFFIANPIGISQWIAGGALERMDLEKMTVETPRGPQTYYRGGAGTRPVVLIHGLGNRASTWVNGVPTLMTRYPLVVIDLAGHGESAPEQGIITAEDLMRGLTTILDQASPDAPVAIVGHGLGGRIALRYALDHPIRVERLVLVNGGVPDDPAVDPVPGDRDGAAELFRATSPDNTPLPAGFVLDDLRQKLQQSAVPRFLDGDAPDSPLVDLPLADIETPVDILWGTDDGLYPVDTARGLVRELPRARLRELPGCGHLPHQQCTGAFLEALFEQLALEPVAADAPGDPGAPAGVEESESVGAS